MGRLNFQWVQKVFLADQSAPETELIRAVVTLRPPIGLEYLEREDHTTDELKVNSLAIAAAMPVNNMATVLSAYGIGAGAAADPFTSVIEATKNQLKRLAKDENVADISEYQSANSTSSFVLAIPSLFGQISDDMSAVARSAYSHSQAAIPSLANGIPAAVFESGLTSAYLNQGCIPTPALWDPQTVPFTIPGGSSGLPTDPTHSLASTSYLAYAGQGARFYHRYSWSYHTPGDINYLINNGIRTVSMSTNSGEQLSNGFNVMAMDDFAYRYPYPVFSSPTGNDGWWLQPGWTGSYNQLLVGNVQDSGWTGALGLDGHFKIDNDVTCGGGATQTRNPLPFQTQSTCIDGGVPATCATDREVPYLVAPGFAPHGGTTVPPQPCAVYGYFMGNACGITDEKWGTSISAPTLNGMVALLLGQKSSLIFQPEGTRAILLLTSRNVMGGYWESFTDGLDGAGVVHGADAISHAKTMTSVVANGSAALKGYWWGTFGASSFSPPTPKVFNLKAPSSFGSSTHMRIVLTWDSNPDFLASVNDLSDMDLVFQGAVSTQYSSSWESNIEIIDVPNSNLSANGTYQVTITPYTWRHHPNARSSTIPAALTWGLVADHAK